MDNTSQDLVVSGESSTCQPLSLPPIQFVQLQATPQASEFRFAPTKKGVLQSGLRGKLGFHPIRYSKAQKEKALKLRRRGLTYGAIASLMSPNSSITSVHRWRSQSLGFKEYTHRHHRHMEQLRRLLRRNEFQLRRNQRQIEALQRRLIILEEGLGFF